MEEDKIRTTVYVDKEMYNKFKALQLGKFSELVNECLAKFLNDEEALARLHLMKQQKALKQEVKEREQAYRAVEKELKLTEMWLSKMDAEEKAEEHKRITEKQQAYENWKLNNPNKSYERFCELYELYHKKTEAKE